MERCFTHGRNLQLSQVLTICWSFAWASENTVQRNRLVTGTCPSYPWIWRRHHGEDDDFIITSQICKFSSEIKASLLFSVPCLAMVELKQRIPGENGDEWSGWSSGFPISPPSVWVSLSAPAVGHIWLLHAHDGATWTLWISNMKQELFVSFCCCQRLWHILGTTLVWRVKPTWCPHSYQVGWCENGFSFIFKRLFPWNWGLGCLWPFEEDKQGCKLQGRVTHCLYLNSIITHPPSQSDGTKTL